MGHILKIIVLLSLTLASCADNSHQDTTFNKGSQGDTTLQTDTTHKLSTTATTPSNSDTLIVDTQAAVFIEPDSLRIAKRKKQVGEERFFHRS